MFFLSPFHQMASEVRGRKCAVGSRFPSQRQEVEVEGRKVEWEKEEEDLTSRKCLPDGENKGVLLKARLVILPRNAVTLPASKPATSCCYVWPHNRPARSKRALCVCYIINPSTLECSVLFWLNLFAKKNSQPRQTAQCCKCLQGVADVDSGAVYSCCDSAAKVYSMYFVIMATFFSIVCWYCPILRTP